MRYEVGPVEEFTRSLLKVRNLKDEFGFSWDCFLEYRRRALKCPKYAPRPLICEVCIIVCARSEGWADRLREAVRKHADMQGLEVDL